MNTVALAPLSTKAQPKISVRIADNIDPDDIDIYRQLSGVTTHILHGSANTIMNVR
jgi:hypothetical protein